MEEVWTEVRRKTWEKNYNRKAEETTTFFVTNVPMEATKGEMQKTFEKHGKLTDVYMGQKVGKNGKHYAFIRYRGVTNAKELERKLDGAKIRGRILAVNIALHERK